MLTNETIAPNTSHRGTTATPRQTGAETDDHKTDEDDRAPVKSAIANEDVSRPAEVPDSDITNSNANKADKDGRPRSVSKGEKMDDEEGEHVVEGDEDTVIY